jgi:hypothetical protein
LKRATFALSLVLGFGLVSQVDAATCTPTGFFRDAINMTAALINPVGSVTGTIDATGCNIGVYYNVAGLGGTVQNAGVFGANYFGVVVNGDAGSVNVDVRSSFIHDIGEVPHNGTQHGVGVLPRIL